MSDLSTLKCGHNIKCSCVYNLRFVVHHSNVGLSRLQPSLLRAAASLLSALCDGRSEVGRVHTDRPREAASVLRDVGPE